MRCSPLWRSTRRPLTASPPGSLAVPECARATRSSKDEYLRGQRSHVSPRDRYHPGRVHSGPGTVSPVCGCSHASERLRDRRLSGDQRFPGRCPGQIAADRRHPLHRGGSAGSKQRQPPGGAAETTRFTFPTKTPCSSPAPVTSPSTRSPLPPVISCRPPKSFCGTSYRTFIRMRTPGIMPILLRAC